MPIRQQLTACRRIVVKVGTRVLTQSNGKPNVRRMEHLVEQLALLHHSGYEVVLVSSGAIGVGMQVLGMSRRPSHLPELQMAAAVGQTQLLTRYDELFTEQRCLISQVLLTHDDLKDRVRHLNARNTMLTLLRNKVIPIVNENDVVAVDEIKFGDNDLLAALVAILVQADALVLLTSADGLREPVSGGRTRRVPYLSKVTNNVLELVEDKVSELSSGGMRSKLEAASMAAKVAAFSVIADGRKPEILGRIFAGEDVGTLIGTGPTKHKDKLRHRQQWLAFFHRAKGAIVVDAGAKEALQKKGRSLLPVGVTGVEGDFGVGSVVDIRTRKGPVFARGLVEYASDEIQNMKGKHTNELKKELGTLDYEEVIHRDNMVLLT